MNELLSGCSLGWSEERGSIWQGLGSASWRQTWPIEKGVSRSGSRHAITFQSNHLLYQPIVKVQPDTDQYQNQRKWDSQE